MLLCALRLEDKKQSDLPICDAFCDRSLHLTAVLTCVNLIMICVLTACCCPLAPTPQLWQMYNGSRPWAGMSHGQIIMTVVSKKHLTFPPGAPSDYVELAQACMAFEAAERPTFERILATLTDMQNGIKSM